VHIPGFIARQFYVAGSLRNTAAGFQLEAHNPMGDGTLVGVGRLRVDGNDVPADAVTAQRAGADEPIRAVDISRQQPVHVSKGDRVVLHVAGHPLAPGEHKLEVELYELNLGRLAFSLTDRLAADAQPAR
jgi:hypothetical protein